MFVLGGDDDGRVRAQRLFDPLHLDRLFRFDEERERVAVEDRPLHDEQGELRVRIGQCADLRRDELFVAGGRGIEIEGELPVEDLARLRLQVQYAQGLLRQLFDAGLIELRSRLHDRSGADLDVPELLDLMEGQRDGDGDGMR